MQSTEIQPDVHKTYRVLDVALEIFLADYADWRKENFLIIDGRTIPSGATAFEQDRQRFTDWCWRVERDKISGAKLAAWRELHAAEKLSKTG